MEEFLKAIGGERQRDSDELVGSMDKDEDKNKEGGVRERVSDVMRSMSYRTTHASGALLPMNTI